MIVHRLCKAAHAALDGEGARRWGGRWNTPGRPMIYTAASPALAVLEVLVHLDLPAELIPDDMVLLTIEVPDDAAIDAAVEALGDDAACRQRGDAFLSGGDALAMRVRSMVVPQEVNLLLNPRHPAMAQVTVMADTHFRLDPPVRLTRS